LNEIDFAHLSPHKNLGGAESCGILIAKKIFGYYRAALSF